MYKTKISSLVVGTMLCVVAIATPVEATFVRLHQSITLRNCTLTIIATEEGLTYSIPKGCGRLVANLGRGQAEGHTAYTKLAVGDNSLIKELFYGTDRRVFLDTRPDYQPADGYMLLAEKGSIYTFYLPGDDSRGLPRSLEFVAVQPDKVAVRFWPGGRVVWLSFDQRTEVDIIQNGVSDAAFRLVNVRDDATVLLHVSFMAAESTGEIHDQTLPIVATSLVVGGFVVFLQAYASTYVMKHRLPGREWWVNHPHDPLK